MKQKNGIIEYGLYLFIFLLPWQTRWIVQQGIIAGGPWEYGTVSIYATEVLLLLLIFIGAISGLAGLALKPNKQTIRKRRLFPFYVALGGLVIWGLLSAFWSTDPMIALYSWVRIFEGIALLFLLLSTYITYRGIGWAFVASGIIQGSLGIYQFLSQSVFGSTVLGMARQFSHQAGASVIQSESLRWLRAYGSLPHPNILAAFLAFALIIGLVLIFTSSSFKERAVLWAGQVLMLAGLFFTFSKSGILALILGLAFLFIFIFLIKDYRGKLLFSQFIFVMLTVFGLLTILYSDPVLTRLQGEQPLERQSVTERVEFIEHSQQIITSNFLLGIGLGNYTIALQKLVPELNYWEYQPVHNVYLLIVSELGVVGLLFFIFFIINGIKAIYNYKIEYQIEMMEIFKEHEKDSDSLELYSDYSFSVHWFLGFAAIFLMLLFLFFFDHFFWTLYFGVMLFWLMIGLWLKEISYMKK